MKFTCVKTCGIYRKGHEYELERPFPVLVMSAIRAGHLVATGGWCAPSEAVYDTTDRVATDGLVELPQVSTVRGGISFEEPATGQPKKVAKLRKKVVVDTLESLSEQTSAGLDDLRGPASV